ncbi:glycerol-3-phosphate 1-O-acyltransferase PlsY [Synechococcus sp. PCC 6312]|uniref:glycerol-3-phosphate 1-O-acyltransferase PlsY n=1 Tax=Synechococcus sp. (strain ATCC 27167 / PCC 6312) TaxID=195253 RepID=UPI00029F46E5|nr:glycerol-3-phosphate 1-O-acyltransferase PlsY [Synechococcus sp. PCC 6312]AFY59991.1 acyl-phosphate glycerol-3-phosphate acyltransferase [Synechococcus sp. PCC 6312]
MNSSPIAWIVGLGLVSYLLGSIPTGYLLGKWLKGIDIRDCGSGSTGATNVLRNLGWPAGLTVLIVDIGKGAVAIGVGRWFQTGWGSDLDGLAQAGVFILLGLLAVIGHSQPVWLRFNGGKSVATSLGVLLALNWPTGLTTLAVFLVVLGLSRIVSLGSMIAALSLPIWFWVFGQPAPYIGLGVGMGLFVIWRHQSNIQRLWQGTEPKLGQSVPSPQTDLEQVPH